MTAERVKNWTHERGEGNDEWLTPPEIIKALGDFDLDPCSPIHRPWDTARYHLTREDDGLMKSWSGRVWMNPPYGRETGKWMQRLFEHGNGIALIFSRTDTEVFHHYVFERANAILFLKGRLSFYTVSGKTVNPAGAASCLVAYGAYNALLLQKSGLKGFFVQLR